MATSDWIEDSNDEVEGWNQKAQEGRKRSQSTGGIQNQFDRKNIGDLMKPSIFRALTMKFGERFKHWITLPNGNRVWAICAATPEQFDNRVGICPFCQHVAAGGGHGTSKEGKDIRPDYNHDYYFIGLIGQVEKVYETIKGKKTATDTIIWLPQPMVLPATEGLNKGITQYLGDPTHEDRQDLRKYNMKLWKYLKKGATGLASDVRYGAEFYDTAPRPTHTWNENNEEVKIDLSIGMILKDQIRAECQVSHAETLSKMLEAPASGGVAGAVATTPEEEPPETPTDAAAPTAVSNDFDDGEPTSTPNETQAPAEAPAEAPKSVTKDLAF